MTWLASLLTVAPLVPMAACYLRPTPTRYRIVACGFAWSWVGDVLMMESGGLWTMGHLWVPLQIGTVLLGLSVTRRQRWAILLGIPALAVVSAVTGPPQEAMVTLAGSALVLYAARGRMAVSLYLYFGAGSVAYFVMASRAGSPEILIPWLVYQSLRLVAYGAFVFAVWRVRWADAC